MSALTPDSGYSVVTNSKGERLRQRLATGEILPVIGIYDVFSASLAMREFDALFVSGFGFSASHYGLPDVGFIAWTDIVDFVRRLGAIARDKHVLVDIDDGYCDTAVACHVVASLEQLGVSGVVLEDQERPRLCGHMDGKRILPLDTYLAKLQAVLATRRDLVVVARTDATDLLEVKRRVVAFRKAGCDAVLADGIPNLEVLTELRKLVDCPIGFNQMAGGKSPVCSLPELQSYGANIAIYSTPCLFAAQRAIETALRSLRSEQGSLANAVHRDATLKGCNEVLFKNLPSARPTPTSTADESLQQRLAGLSPAQHALLVRRMEEKGHAAKAPGAASVALPKEPPKRVDVDAEGRPVSVYPASNGQERMWFLHRYLPESPVYNSPSAFHLRGDLRIEALEAAFLLVIQRHENLRTTFAVEEGGLVQRVSSSSAFRLERRSFMSVPAGDRKKAVHDCLTAAVSFPFELSAAPPFRVLLISTDQDEHVLLYVSHHIISDGWSRSNFYRELSIAYTALAANTSIDLPELPIQFPDYSAWQRRWAKSAAFEEQAAYWKAQLAGELEPLNLPKDGDRSAADLARGDECSLEIGRELVSALKARAQERGATLFMILLAAYKVLLHRYTAQTDIIVGVPIANRRHPEVEGLIGPFVNTLALRTAFSSDKTFAELLEEVKETALQAYEHQDLPFELLVRILQVERDSDRTPVFQTTFVLQDFPEIDLQLNGLESTPFPVSTQTSKFDLSLEVTPTPSGWLASMQFNTGLFSSGRARQMLEHWHAVLNDVALHPDRRVSEISLLSPNEKQQILVEWNRTEREFPKDTCLHELFEQQVERTPEAVALVFGNQELTYQELEARANQLGHYLQKGGVGPDTLVGICAERSLEMVIGLLGILKAGGCYVPLDPEYPKERLAFMLKDTSVSVVLTQAHLMETIPSCPARILRLDADWPVIANESESSVESAVKAENLAYTMYTSGSTGQPKGVMTPHRGIVNRMLWMQEAYQLTSADRVMQKTPFSFDISLWEFFWPLQTGAPLILAKPGGHRDPAYLAELIAREKITTLHFVPSMLQVFLEQVGASPLLSTLKRVICGGEALSMEVQRRFFSTVGAELHNLYGPTEASVEVTFWACQRDSLLDIVPLGRPIANIQLYILDQHLQPVPVGVAGELHLGGVGLARGYHNRPDLTAEKFIGNPFSTDPKARLYRTGDLARYLPDGNVEYLGRLDYQVKIRGFRVELGEIQEILNQHPAVQTSVVVTREDMSGDKRLVAYLVSRNGAVSSSELREHLLAKLPDYMVPAHFVTLDVLPLTPSGKVDRKALPEPDFESGVKERKFVAPRTPTERILANIWSEMLGLEQVGVDENFFALGGHSILAVRVIDRINQALSFNVSIPLFFRNPTIEKLAKILPRGNHSTPDAQLVGTSQSTVPLFTFQGQGSRAPLFFLHGDWTGGGLYCGPLSQLLGEDQPFYSLPPHHHSGKEAMLTIEDMAAEHLSLIQKRTPHGPYVLGGYCIGAVVAMEIARQLTEKGEPVAQLLLVEPSFISGPLLREFWYVFDVIGTFLKWNLKRKIYYFSRCGVPLDRWLKKSIRDKIKAVFNRLGLGSQIESGDGRVQGEGAAEILASFDFAKYLHAFRLYHFKPLFCPATLYLSEERPASRVIWTKHAHKIFPQASLETIPGNHLTSIVEHVSELADRMKKKLEGG